MVVYHAGSGACKFLSQLPKNYRMMTTESKPHTTICVSYWTDNGTQYTDIPV